MASPAVGMTVNHDTGNVYASLESLAAQLVDNMDTDVASEFAQAGAEASSFKQGHIMIAAGVIKLLFICLHRLRQHRVR
jgi:hypothetical protein